MPRRDNRQSNPTRDKFLPRLQHPTFYAYHQQIVADKKSLKRKKKTLSSETRYKNLFNMSTKNVKQTTTPSSTKNLRENKIYRRNTRPRLISLNGRLLKHRLAIWYRKQLYIYYTVSLCHRSIYVTDGRRRFIYTYLYISIYLPANMNNMASAVDARLILIINSRVDVDCIK